MGIFTSKQSIIDSLSILRPFGSSNPSDWSIEFPDEVDLNDSPRAERTRQLLADVEDEIKQSELCPEERSLPEQQP